jgi:hypothetical protein
MTYRHFFKLKVTIIVSCCHFVTKIVTCCRKLCSIARIEERLVLGRVVALRDFPNVIAPNKRPSATSIAGVPHSLNQQVSGRCQDEVNAHKQRHSQGA